MNLAMLRDRLIAPRRIHVRMVAQRERGGANDEVVDAGLDPCDLIDLLAKRQQVRDVVLRYQIEMRDRSCRLREAFGDRAPHRRQRNLFRFELLQRRQRRRFRFLRRGRRRFEVLDVVGDDASARPAALNLLDTDAELARHLAREWRGAATAVVASRGRHVRSCRRSPIDSRRFHVDRFGVVAGGMLD